MRLRPIQLLIQVCFEFPVQTTDSWLSVDGVSVQRKSLRLLISIGQKSEESIDTKTSMFSLGTADDN